MLLNREFTNTKKDLNVKIVVNYSFERIDIFQIMRKKIGLKIDN
jgi:hypothetical protein